jgi:hypothetical protein
MAIGNQEHVRRGPPPWSNSCLHFKGLLLRSGNALKQGAQQIAGRGIAIDLR